MDRQVWIKRSLQAIGFLLALSLLILLYFLYRGGNLNSRQSVLSYIHSFGWMAPVAYFLLQYIFTVVPGMPNTLILGFGPFLFGSIQGFLINYVSLVIGSLTNFAIGRRYGSSVVKNIVGTKTYQQATQYFKDQKHAQPIFFLLMLTPFTPADVLSYLAGISRMNSRFFLFTILIGKISVLLIVHGIVELLLQSLF